MKIVRYLDPEQEIRFAALQDDGTALELNGDIYADPAVSDRPARIEKQLAPIAPREIIGIGLNYRRHAEESGAAIPKHPVVFMKPLNTVQHPGDPIEIPTHMASHEVDYECELAVVIGKACKNVSEEDALDHVLGYTCANDVSARDWQLEFGGGQWLRGKAFDTFCPLGPVVTTADEIPDPNALAIKTTLNDEVVQDWNTSDMIFSVRKLISFLSGSTTLAPGTVILTGTPHGVGMAAKPPRWLRAGDRVTVEVEGIGALVNSVVLE